MATFSWADNIQVGYGVLGGVIIGLTTSVLLLFTGKITGISGISEDVAIYNHKYGLRYWAWVYVAGIIVSGVVLKAGWVQVYGLDSTTDIPALSELNPVALCAGALAVGFGTRMGCGCTSGHGVCGLSRLSPRSLVAVGAFMCIAIITASVTRTSSIHTAFYSTNNIDASQALAADYVVLPSILALFITILVTAYKNRSVVVTKRSTDSDYETIAGLTKQTEEKTAATMEEEASMKKMALKNASPSDIHVVMFALPNLQDLMAMDYVELVVCFLSAFAFGIGLAVGGMANRNRVLQFLDIFGRSGWDPTLLGVMGGAVCVNLVTFNLMHRYNPKIRLSRTHRQLKDIIHIGLVPANTLITPQLVGGSVLFGFGWGLTGYCPGPATLQLGAGISEAGYFIPFMLIGMMLQDLVFRAPEQQLKFNLVRPLAEQADIETGKGLAPVCQSDAADPDAYKAEEVKEKPYLENDYNCDCVE